MAFGSGHLMINIGQTGSADWHVQLHRGSILLEQGKTYKLAVVGRAPTDHGFTFYAGKASDPWNSYSGYPSGQFSTDFAEVSTVFSMTSPTDPLARIVLDIGSKVGSIEIQSVTLEEVSFDFTTQTRGSVAPPLITVYPNPASEAIALRVDDPATVTLQIYDLQGRIIREIQNYQSDSYIGIGGLSPGTHVVMVYVNSKLMISRFVKM